MPKQGGKMRVRIPLCSNEARSVAVAMAQGRFTMEDRGAGSNPAAPYKF